MEPEVIRGHIELKPDNLTGFGNFIVTSTGDIVSLPRHFYLFDSNLVPLFLVTEVIIDGRIIYPGPLLFPDPTLFTSFTPARAV
jgi:hypothetical protein